MAGDPTLESFLGRWLTARMQDAAASKPASALHRTIPGLLPDVSATAFLAGLASRIAGLAGLAAGIEREVAPPPPDSVLGRWLRHARRLAQRWDPARWDVTALELTREKNPMMIAAVLQGLEESLDQGAAARRAAEQIRALRAPVEREFGEIPVPPAPEAPWDAAEYLFPARGREVVARLGPGLVSAASAEPPGAPVLESIRGLSAAFRQIEAGWPVRRGGLAAMLRRVGDAMPEGSGLAAPLREAAASVGAGSPSAAQPPTAAGPVGAGPGAGRDAVLGQLGTLGRELLASASPEARAFGERLRGLADSGGASPPAGIAGELVGCLAYLDEDDRPGGSGRWRAAALERLARIAEQLGGGEVLGERLIGQPLGRWAEFVTVVDFDDRAPPGEPRRITKLDRAGYVLVFSDGTRRALVRARVRVAL